MIIVTAQSPHFHIHWRSKKDLDWECFETLAEAMTRAGELAGPEELFTIEEVFPKCPILKGRHSTAT